MGMKKSLRNKAVHFVTDLTTGLLNPISDKSSSPLHPPPENLSESKRSQLEKELISKEDGDLVDGPDTSSFTAFLCSLLSSSESGHDLNQAEQNDNQEETGDSSDNIMKENGRRKSLLSREKTRNALYASLPAIVQGRKWLLLYSTWRHGISLSTLYRRSMLWPGLSLLVVGDRKGAVFGGLVEAPLKPTNKKYQGTNSTFVFTDRPGDPVIFRPTGANRYFTLCSTEFLAIGGGGHFALYLDSDLLNGSSSFSETYGNPCLALSEDFEVKEIELWGFVYGSKYDEILALSRTEMPGICRW
ncbi:hypothetical protein V6Z11_D12G080800 [Gossypium hirsutum]